MNNLDIRKEQVLDRINNARIVLDQALECGLITESDIFNLLRKDKNCFLDKTKGYKNLLLKQIVGSPFILCDQNRLSLNLKKLLPTILEIRCEDEVEELEKMQELGLINDKELKNEKEMIKFIYYLSSEDGRQIIKNGHVKNVKSNVLYKIKK